MSITDIITTKSLIRENELRTSSQRSAYLILTD